MGDLTITLLLGIQRKSDQQNVCLFLKEVDGNLYSHPPQNWNTRKNKSWTAHEGPSNFSERGIPMFYHKRYTEKELRNDQRLCRIFMSAVTAAMVIDFVIEMFRLTA